MAFRVPGVSLIEASNNKYYGVQYKTWHFDSARDRHFFWDVDGPIRKNTQKYIKMTPQKTFHFIIGHVNLKELEEATMRFEDNETTIEGRSIVCRSGGLTTEIFSSLDPDVK